MRSLHRLCLSVFSGILLIGQVEQSQAAPAIKNLSLRGLQIGATTTLTIEGSELGSGTQIVLPFVITKQEIKPSATDDSVTFEITLDPAIVPGIYSLRVANARGISSPLLVGIDALPERQFAAEAGTLPVAMTGTISGGTILRSAFDGRAGQSIAIDLEAHRLGSLLNPVIHLLDARGVQLAWSQMVPSIAGDARIATKLPADGRYTVEVHDNLYRGNSVGYFRIKIGEFRYADLAFPLSGQRGTKALFEPVSTNLPAPETFNVDLSSSVVDLAGAWHSDQPMTGARPQIVVDELPDIREQTSGPVPQPITSPAVIHGRLSVAREEDRFLLPVTAGETIRIDMIAARAGSPVDGVLAVRKESGEQLAGADDSPNSPDPVLDFKVPDGVDKVVVAVRDLLGRHGPEYVYRLRVAPADRPDFRLQLFGASEQVPGGGAQIVRVRAQRAGYQGPIRLSVLGLPANVGVANQEIPADATDALLSLIATGSPGYAVGTIVGTGVGPYSALVREARVDETPASRLQPWLRGELGVAVTRSSSLSVTWETDSSTSLPLGGQLPARVKVTRAPLAAGNVRLSIVTSQITPKKEVTENNQKRQVDDLERTLRFDGVPMIPTDKAEGTASILVPADLPGIPYDLAIRAELLAADGKAVVASAVTPAYRLEAIQPLRIELAGAPQVEAKAGSGETGRLTGRVSRLGEFPYPVTVTLTGLPGDFLAPAVEVAADASEFSLPVSLPFKTPEGELANVSLVATAQPGGGATVRSNTVPVTVKVVAGGPPPALYRLFEDEPHFVSLLNEGGGKATVETTDRFEGTAALRVTPDQKFRAKLPGLGVKIAERPGDGEYRYLRFAWKKIGGGSVLLQLNANGQWGPARGQGTPGYRYEAGPSGNTFNAEAVKISDRLPYGWTVVTRDLFADFGAFQLDGIAFTPGDGEAALFDGIYLAKSPEDFKDCPAALPADQPLAVFEDQQEFVMNLSQGAGTVALLSEDHFTGAASAKVTPEQRYNPALPGLGVKVRQNPAPGEFRYLQFAWKKQGGQRVCLQVNHDGQWGPVPSVSPLKFRYDAGPGPGESYGGAKRLDENLPNNWVVITRDLFADFGEFTFTGLALCPMDGEFALFDHIYLGRTLRDFDLTAQ